MASFHAAMLEEVALHASIIMDMEKLHSDIKAAYTQDSAARHGLSVTSDASPSR